MVLAKPHCGLMASREVFELIIPSTAPLVFGRKRNGVKSPARGVAQHRQRHFVQLDVAAARPREVRDLRLAHPAQVGKVLA